MNSQENRDRLAREVKVARLRKFKTVDKARIEAGVSRGAWDNVEHGASVKEFTLAAIEEALDWPAGYALSVLEGHEGRQVRGPGRVSELIEEYVSTHPGATDTKMADAVGVARSTMQRWRTQALTEPPDADAINRLAVLLDRDVKEVFYAVGVDTGLVVETVVSNEELIRRRTIEARAAAQRIPDADTGSA